MSKASTSSIQHLLRQLYVAKNSLAASAAAAASSSSSSSSAIVENAAGAAISGWSGHSSGHGIGSGGGIGATAAYSTASRSLHSHSGESTPASSSGVQQHHHHHAHTHGHVSSTGEWATTAAGNSSNSSSKAKHSHSHHYSRHSSNVGSSSSSSLLPSFWSQSPPPPHHHGTNGRQGSPPPVPPFTSNTLASTSSSSSSSSAHAISAPAAHPSSSSSSSTLLANSAISASSSQLSDHPPYYAASQSSDVSRAAPSLSEHGENTATAPEDGNKISQSAHHLTFHPGAYGIPKRLSSVAGGDRSNASAKGKEKELEPNDPIQAQIEQIQSSLLSVQVGEDAYFVRHDSLGVADGVGGWSGRKGADPGLFAARLMHHCSAELAQVEATNATEGIDKEASTDGGSGRGSRLAFVSSASSTANPSASAADGSASASNKPDSGTASSDTTRNKDGVATSEQQQQQASSRQESVIDEEHALSPSQASDPVEILHRAWDLTLTEFFDFELIGSSTALIALLKDDELRLANIGDCCLSIIRNGNEYIFRSQEQQHSFNYPFQLGTNSKDTPRKDGQRFSIKVQKNDLVILSSDGLVDNLFDEDILEEVERQAQYDRKTLAQGSTSDGNQDDNSSNSSSNFYVSPERLSKALCSRAKAVSEDQRAVTSPFQQRANEEGIHFVGGKHDDITVLVAIIGDKND